MAYLLVSKDFDTDKSVPTSCSGIKVDSNGKQLVARDMLTQWWALDIHKLRSEP